MEKQVLSEEYFGYQLEVTINETQPAIKLEFIPDSVKKSVLALLAENQKEGAFGHEETGDYFSQEYPDVTFSGSWKVIESPIMMEKIVSSFFYYMWNRWSKEECKAVFGYQHVHFFEKWCGLCRGSSSGAAEKFYAELSINSRQLIVNRANEVYEGSIAKL